MIGLPGHRPDLTEMPDIVETTESHVQPFSVDKLEKLNAENAQAGVEPLNHEDFKRTEAWKMV